MLSQLPLALGSLLLSLILGKTVHPYGSGSELSRVAGPLLLLSHPWSASAISSGKRADAQNASTRTTVWAIEDTYEGDTFFDTFDFFTGGDPTHGMVNYTTADFAFANKLAYVDNGTVIMKGDDSTTLDSGVYRNSVRISSHKQYNTGLFILDLNRAPWGCGVWPAWWTLGGGQWPYTGEIDILEGVHDNEHNQVTWHTGPNCSLTPSANFTGSLVTTNGQPNLDCDGSANGNAGCGITEWSRASYGPTFDAAGGGVFAMKWDDTGIVVWSFYRNLVPLDVQSGEPKPETWGLPVAALAAQGCDPIANFVNHSIIFDITFCGDWAGNTYDTSGCPGTCTDRLMDPANFVNASWSINTLKVYKKVALSRPVSGAARLDLRSMPVPVWLPFLLALCVLVA